MAGSSGHARVVIEERRGCPSSARDDLRHGASLIIVFGVVLLQGYTCLIAQGDVENDDADTRAGCNPLRDWP